jgi:hypothetical protein
MKKQPTRKMAPVPPLPKKKIAHITRKPAAPKWVAAAQMPDYLCEEHPEFCA